MVCFPLNAPAHAPIIDPPQALNKLRDPDKRKAFTTKDTKAVQAACRLPKLSSAVKYLAESSSASLLYPACRCGNVSRDWGRGMNDIGRDKAVKTLARSLFGFAFFAWIPMLMTWCLFVLSPISPDEGYARLRVIIILGFGMATLLALGIATWTFRLDEAASLRIASRWVRVFGNRWLALILLLASIEASMLSFIALVNIAPSITHPLKFLLLCWTLVFGILLMTIHWHSLQKLYCGTRPLWAGLGIAFAIIPLLAALLILGGFLVNATGISGRLRGALDYRRLEFVDDGNVPTPRQFWAERGQIKVRWLPYNYWTEAPFAGASINIDQQGLRHTPRYTDEESAPDIAFFGGSALWGEGARDAYTIPGHIAKGLADEGQPAIVLNYGQNGYVSTQDLHLFQAQLALGRAPAAAVFYQGFNDVFSAYRQGRAGLPYQEQQRVSDVEAGRILRGGQPVLRLPDGDISSYDWTLASSPDASAAAIAERWLANRRLGQAAADEYRVRLLFVWQPALFAKQKLVGAEAGILAEFETQHSGLVALYQEVDKLIRQRLASEAADDVLMLTDLFRDTERELFYDYVHITEIGNLLVAQAIQSRLADLLTE